MLRLSHRTQIYILFLRFFNYLKKWITQNMKAKTLGVYRNNLNFPKPKFQYVVLPYIRLRVQGLDRNMNDISFGGYRIWKDNKENWQNNLGILRPANHLARYVDQKGTPLGDLWIATPARGNRVYGEGWKHLVATLFYLCFARNPSLSLRPFADEFYFEPFDVPEGAPTDATSHTQLSKYGMHVHSHLKIYPGPDVTFNGHDLVIPGKKGIGNLSLYTTALDLFVALDAELKKQTSRVLKAIEFFLQANFESESRSTYAEDIQNICTAVEALLDLQDRGKTGEQVGERLANLFQSTARTPTDIYLNRPASDESPEALQQLKKWVNELYLIRNSYTHGKNVLKYRFNGRSVWQDAFEVFRLALNRSILKRPERRPAHGTELSKLLMSNIYIEDFIRAFQNGRKVYQAAEDDPTERLRIVTLLEKSKIIDPERVEFIRSPSQFDQALYGMSCFIYYSAKKAKASELVSRMEKVYQETTSNSAGKSFDCESYLRMLAPNLGSSDAHFPILGGETSLKELTGLFTSFYRLYKKFSP